MIIDDALLERLETLSSLRMNKDQREGMKNNLGEIVDFVEILNDLNISHIDATCTTRTGGTPMEEDVPRSNQELAQHVLAHAPKQEDHYFIVPKIIE
jgi:aspartyl-tRNA(Asn)/glutamyl-tRNA(Gln) amidotransferase subunit C